MLATKNDLFEELQLSTEIVTLSSGKEIIVTEITAPDYMELCKFCAIGDMKSPDEDGNIKLDISKFNGALLAYCVVDDKGERVFDDSDIDQLINSANKPLMNIVGVAKRLNGLSGTEEKSLGSTEGDSSTGE